MASRQSKAKPAYRQPSPEGVDAIYQDGDYTAYANGKVVGFYADKESALIAARQVYFDQLEADRYVSADNLAAIAEMGEVLDTYAAEHGICITDARLVVSAPICTVGMCKGCRHFSSSLVYGLCPACRLLSRYEPVELLERAVGWVSTVGNCRQCGNWTMRLLDGLCPQCKPRVTANTMIAMVA
jgi:hypothetical protein